MFLRTKKDLQIEHTQKIDTTQPYTGLPGGSDGKETACNTGVLGWEDPLEEGMATYSSILVWRIPMDRGAWGATVHGIANSRTRLNRLSTVLQDSGEPAHCLLPSPQQGLGPKLRQDKGTRLDF